MATKKQQSGNISKGMQKRAEERRKKRQNLLIIGAVVLVLILAVGAAVVWNGASQQDTQTTALPLNVSVDKAYQMVENGAFLLDVREQSEWDDFHAPQATLIPLGELASRINEVPRDQDIVVICNSGNRSQQGRDILLDAGFENVTSVDGGSQAWRAAGYPTE